MQHTLMRPLVVTKVNLKVELLKSQQFCLDFLLRDFLVEDVLVLLEDQELVNDGVLLPHVIEANLLDN